MSEISSEQRLKQRAVIFGVSGTAAAVLGGVANYLARSRLSGSWQAVGTGAAMAAVAAGCGMLFGGISALTTVKIAEADLEPVLLPAGSTAAVFEPPAA